MNRKVILFFALTFELVGNFAPMLFGVNDLLTTDGILWSMLGGLVGGLFGVWVGVVVSKRFF
jgi:hypothetical protein